MRVRLTQGVVDTERREISTSDGVLPLREKEARLFACVLERAGDVVTREHLYQEVFGYGPNVLSRALDTTVRRLRAKLDQVEDAELIQTVYGTGYRYVGPARADERQHGMLGRDLEFRESVDVLEHGPKRLLVLTGVGGSGKTLMARELLARVVDPLWLDLEPHHTLEAVQVALAGTLGATAVDTLAEQLAMRPSLTLFLDNAEHLPLGRMLPSWLQYAERLRIVVTSRVHQDLDGHIVRLGPLSRQTSLRLFQQHSREAVTDVSTADALLATLQDHPLAVVLAAKRSHLLGLSSLLDEVRVGLTVLVDHDRQPRRHRSLQALFDATLDTLAPDVLSALRCVSVLPDPFDGREFITLTASNLSALATLVDAHLVRREEDQRFRVMANVRRAVEATTPVAVRQRAAERWLEVVSTRVSAHRRHRSDLPTRALLETSLSAAVEFSSPHAAELLHGLCSRIRADHGDVQALQRWVDAVGPLVRTDPQRALFETVRSVLDLARRPLPLDAANRAVGLSGELDDTLVLEALFHRATAHARRGDAAAALEDIEEMERRAESAGESWTLLGWLWGFVLTSTLDSRQAEHRRRRIAPLVDELAPADRHWWHQRLAYHHARRLEFDLQLQLCNQAVDYAEEHGNITQLAQVHGQRAAALMRACRGPEALEDARRARALAIGGTRWLRAMTCYNNAYAALCMLQWDEAREAVTLGARSAGSDAFARKAAEGQEATIDRTLGHAPRSVDADEELLALGGSADERWFLWFAQSGELSRAIEAAEGTLLPVPREANQVRMRQLGTLGELYLAARRWREASEMLVIAHGAHPADSPNGMLFGAALAVAQQHLGNAHHPPRERFEVPFLSLSAQCWRAVWAAQRGETELAEGLLREVERVCDDPRLTGHSELAWRAGVARALCGSTTASEMP